jgi:hypothetical protein
VATLACGLDHCLALTIDGKVFGWGRNSNQQLGNQHQNNLNSAERLVFPSELPIVFILCGNHFSMAMALDGSLFVNGNTIHSKDFPLSSPRLVSGFTFMLPRDADLGEKWRKIFKWLFLGKSDEDSALFIFPIEILYHTVLLLARRHI